MAVPRPSGGGTTKRKAKRKPSVGPQGLSGPASSNTSPAARKVRAKTGPQPIAPSGGVVQTVASQPAVKKAARKARRRTQANLRVSGDRPTKGGRTAGVDATKSEEYRDVVKYLLSKEYTKKLGKIGEKGKANDDLSTDELRGALYQLRDPKTDRNDAANLFMSTHTKRSKLDTSLEAPVLKVLEQTTRPLHAIAGATDAAIKGKNVLRAASRGIQNKDKTTFSKILKDLGAPKAVQTVGGFGLDVALDPTTYVTFGAGSVARKEALKAAENATNKALTKGLTKVQAKKFGQRAAAKVEREAKDERGLTVKLAGKEAPGVRKATAKVVPRRAKRKAAESRPGRAVRTVAADVNPNVAPAGMSKGETREVVRATRTARAKAHRGQYAAQQRAIAVKKQIGAANYEKVIDALEAGNLRGLSPELRRAAVEVRSQFRYANRVRRQSGIKGGERKNYVPHQLTDDALEAEGKKATKGRVGNRSINPSSSKKRSDQRSLAEHRAATPGRYSEDLPQLLAGRMTEATTSAAKATLNRRLAEQGRKVPMNNKALELKPGESVFHIKGSDIKEIVDKDVLGKLTRSTRMSKGGKKLKASYQAKHGGRFVILNKQAVDQALEGVTPQLQGPGIVKGLDKLQGGFKAVATVPNPGFHIRNLIGDSQNAYLAESAPRLARNMGQSARALKHLGTREKALRDLSAKVDPSDAGLKIKGKKVTYAELVAEAEKVGAIRTGFIAREIPELLQTEVTKKRDRLSGLSRQLQNREDVVRLATYIGGRKQGLSPELAAERAAKYHFDYSHLTSFERNIARRAMPFYTFSARNIPLQLGSLVTKPGKYANYEKLREEAAIAAGFEDPQPREIQDLYAKLEEAGVKLPDGYAKYLTEWEQRNAGIPVSLGGMKYTVSAALPLTDVALFPGAAGMKQVDEYFQRAMSLATPVVKTPVEIFNNYSFFFRDKLERDFSPLVAAPAYVGKFPKAWQRKLGITRGPDKRTGEDIWLWPGKVDYVAHAIPGPTNYAQQFMSGTDRRGKGTAEKVVGYLGVKAVPFDPASAAIGLAYGRMADIQKELSALRQQKHNGSAISAENPTPRYRKLLGQLKIVTEVAYDGKATRGDVILPTNGAPPKPRSSSSGDSRDDFGSGSSGSSREEFGVGSSSSSRDDFN